MLQLLLFHMISASKPSKVVAIAYTFEYIRADFGLKYTTTLDLVAMVVDIFMRLAPQ